MKKRREKKQAFLNETNKRHASEEKRNHNRTIGKITVRTNETNEERTKQQQHTNQTIFMKNNNKVNNARH